MLTPISFLQVLVVAVFGYWLFGEALDRCTLLGAPIIFGSNIYIAHRETRLAQAGQSPTRISRQKPSSADVEADDFRIN